MQINQFIAYIFCFYPTKQKIERKIIKENFWNIRDNDDRNLYEDDLG